MEDQKTLCLHAIVGRGTKTQLNQYVTEQFRSHGSSG